MGKLHPSYVINLAVDERLLDEEGLHDLKRFFLHVGPITTELVPAPVEPEAFSESQEEDLADAYGTLTVRINPHGDVWTLGETDDLWNESMIPWLDNLMYKISNTLTASNATRERAAREALALDRVVFDFVNGPTVTMTLDYFTQNSQEIAQRITTARTAGSQDDIVLADVSEEA